MKTSILAALGLAALAHAQGALPTCAQSCTLDAIGATGCQVTDAACICTNQAFLTSSQTCIEGACSPADVQAAAEYAASFCASAGVTLTFSSAPASSAPASSAPASSAPASSAPAATTPASSAAPPAASPPVSQISDGQPQAPTSAAPATFTGAALPMQKNIVGGLGAAVLAVAAVL